ncbi:hypothetical protein GGQ68_000882 [Sagittula marina]|uniref:Extensin-like C-terminal domain-containing protein n=1 Tax=Sagittula marina TaxID=943940 RepID=A0A7W6DN50_9RHOB|nr:hypothetical protein [Sagittula marina]
MKRWGLILCLSAVPVWAQEGPEESLRPKARIVEAETPDVEVPAEEALPGGVKAEALPKGMRDELRVDDTEYAVCLAALDRMGVTYTEVDPIIPDDDADCGILRPLEVTEIAPGVAVTPPAVIRCETAEAMALWVHDFVLPAAERLEERGALTEVRNGSGYICRRRNNVADGKLSEHAFGNAVDVMGFTFENGPPIPVEPREAQGSMAEAFQDAVRASACMEFTTVLGPGSNASHDDHLHLDVIRRTRGWRLCEQGGATSD